VDDRLPEKSGNYKVQLYDGTEMEDFYDSISETWVINYIWDINKWRELPPPPEK